MKGKRMEKPKVNVVLATYNGERFLKRQLDSIVSQTYENIDIYIRDDGSKDNTVAFIEKYIKENAKGRRIVLLDNGGVNLRCPQSFYEILRRCDKGDYYSFCDQDDEWYPEKIAWAVERLEQEDKNEILLYYTACDYYTDKGEFIRRSPKQKEKLELSDVIYYTPGSGFTMVINEKARQELLLQVKLGKELHDRWLIRGAVCFGKVLYDERSSATHIRHEEAVTSGDAGTGNLIKYFIQQEILGPGAKEDKKSLQYFYHTFENNLSMEQKKELSVFTRDRFSLLNWFRKVFYPKRLRTRTPGEIALRILFVLGRI